MQDLRLGLKRSNPFPVFFSFNSMPNASGVDLHLFMGSSLEETPSLDFEKILSLVTHYSIRGDSEGREDKHKNGRGDIQWDTRFKSGGTICRADILWFSRSTFQFPGLTEVLQGPNKRKMWCFLSCYSIAHLLLWDTSASLERREDGELQKRFSPDTLFT